MIVDKDTARLICKLEYELGSQTYNPHSYNGWTGEEGCGFKYPVKYCNCLLYTSDAADEL